MDPSSPIQPTEPQITPEPAQVPPAAAPTTPAPVSPPSQTAQPTQTPAPASIPESYTQPPQKSSRGKLFAVLAAVIVLLGLAGAAGYFFLKNMAVSEQEQVVLDMEKAAKNKDCQGTISLFSSDQRFGQSVEELVKRCNENKDDYFTSSKDLNIVSTKLVSEDVDKAVVEVVSEEGDARATENVHLIKEDGKWVIDDIERAD